MKGDAGQPDHLVLLHLDVEEFRQQVEIRRKELGYRWSDLAQMCGISTPYLHQILHGKKNNPSRKTSDALRTLARALNLALDPRPVQQPLPTLADAAQAVQARLGTLDEQGRRQLYHLTPTGRAAWVISTMLGTGVSRDTLARELQMTVTALMDLQSKDTRVTLQSNTAHRLCRAAGINGEFLFQGVLRYEPAARWQQLHARLDGLREDGVAPESIQIMVRGRAHA